MGMDASAYLLYGVLIEDHAVLEKLETDCLRNKYDSEFLTKEELQVDYYAPPNQETEPGAWCILYAHQTMEFENCVSEIDLAALVANEARLKENLVRALKVIKLNHNIDILPEPFEDLELKWYLTSDYS